MRRPFMQTTPNMMAVRGGKKKAAKGPAAGPVRLEVVNILKDREDPVIVESQRYPPWLFKILD